MDLAELIQRRREHLGLSYQGIAERAADYGLELTSTNVYHLATKAITRIPKPETLRALAVVLQVPVGDVLNAAAESVGLKIKRTDAGDEATRTFTALIEDRDPDEVAAALDIVQSALRIRPRSRESRREVE
ncbi:hypothetical protein AB0L13_40265 [Saccharopolyspora shandongensis]|uniref:hypothetical protein n=1 Tax=Saccharopolyspora shandongensis TaxID=418495 RepID=UPI00343B63BF